MQDNRFFIFVILLAFSTSLNQGQKLKINDRRSAGLVAYPRIGRNSEIASLPRMERAFGIIHKPRIGRSDESSNLNRFQDLPADIDMEFYIPRDVEPEVLLNLDYEDYADKSFKHADKIQKDGAWLMPDHVHGYKDLRFAQKIDDPRLYYSILRGSRNSQGQGGYTPRLGRENEHDATSFL
ncbi:PREDICTED: CAPA peptides-like isoform X1 [Cyphomyrmex costatus]|uniref:CAPA peptides-like isoform X1 n=1 Tax=Cyphomyrmex costatus TaxID=456900 RepID=UPI0008523D74|nr:PREDICTED: CAPA peptides-like isoform X1 [Cyphomyrmex costatus]